MKKTTIKIALLLSLLAIMFNSCKTEDCPKIEGCVKKVWYNDFDGDGYGNPLIKVESCEKPIDFVSDNTDNNDNDSLLNPVASEIPDNDIDENGDGVYDYHLYKDNDGDFFGAGVELVEVKHKVISDADLPSGYVWVGGDCDDSDFDVNPRGVDVLNKDNNCDGEAGTVYYYLDNDGDLFGDPSSKSSTFFSGSIKVGNDCDDSNKNVNPSMREIQNGQDDDCNGIVDGF